VPVRYRHRRDRRAHNREGISSGARSTRSRALSRSLRYLLVSPGLSPTWSPGLPNPPGRALEPSRIPSGMPPSSAIRPSGASTRVSLPSGVRTGSFPSRQHRSGLPGRSPGLSSLRETRSGTSSPGTSVDYRTASSCQPCLGAIATTPWVAPWVAPWVVAWIRRPSAGGGQSVEAMRDISRLCLTDSL
jgi:hypothetical protein